MEALVLLDGTQNARQGLGGIMNVLSIVERALLCCNRSHQARGIAMLGGFAHRGPTELGPPLSHRLHRRPRGLRHAWVGVMHRRPPPRQGPPHCGQGQRLIPVAAEMPAPEAVRIHGHPPGQGHHFWAPPPLGDVPPTPAQAARSSRPAPGLGRAGTPGHAAASVGGARGDAPGVPSRA
jgi:hypothetical protein